MPWEIKNIADETYFSYGNIFNGFESPKDRHEELVVSNSFMKSVFKTNLHHYLTVGCDEIDDDLQEIFDTGSAFHCYVLEHDEFYDRYHVSNVKDATKNTTRIGETEFIFIEASHRAIEEKYPEVLDGENVELTIIGEIDGAKVKCKIDKLNIKKSGTRYISVEILDLKGVYFDHFKLKKSPSGERWELRKKLSNNDYDLQAYFYTKLVEEWLQSINQHCEVSFSLLVASKETYQVQKYRVGPEMMETGRIKYESVWPDIRDFVLFGKDRLVDEEVL
ncbi:MAG: PD-(D/E)XK nuclease-like domain-containing protein [Sulfurimonas sp.]